MTSSTVLRIDASMRGEGSASRKLTDTLISTIAPQAQVIQRDLKNGVTIINEDWIAANFTPQDNRTESQANQLQESDTLIQEIQSADTLVFGVPIYNFGIPGALKAWFDQICRAGITFKYTENGPVGLLEGKKAYVVVASGGVPLGSAVDFATPHVKQLLAFIGITDVTFIDASGQAMDPAAALQKAEQQISALAA